MDTTTNTDHLDPTACARSGLNPAVYASHFIDGIQTKCAAGNHCLQPPNMSVSDSFHRCMVCTLRMHSYVTCGATYESFRSKHGIPSLPPYGQFMLAQFANREEQLQICGCCIEKYRNKNISSSSSACSFAHTGNGDDEVDFSLDVGPYENSAHDDDVTMTMTMTTTMPMLKLPTLPTVPMYNYLLILQNGQRSIGNVGWR